MQAKTIQRAVRVAFVTPNGETGWGVPLMVEGPPGGGKSGILRSLAKAWGVPCEVFSPGLRGEGALGVIQVYDEDTDTMRSPGAAWAAKFAAPGARGICFVDELNTVREDIQAPLLGLIHDKVLGEAFLGQGVRMIGAQNPPGCGGANTTEIPASLANRFCFLPKFTGAAPEEQADFWVSRDVFAEMDNPQHNVGTAPESLAELEARVREGWTAAYARTSAVYAGFVRGAGAMYLNAMPEEYDPAASRAWPSNRSWTNALHLMTTCEILGEDTDIRDMLIAGCVGEAASLAFCEYLAALDLPDVRAVLEGREEWEHVAVRPDRTYAVLAQMVSLVNQDPQLAEGAWRLLGEVVENGADLVIDPAEKLVRNGHYNRKFKGAEKVAARVSKTGRASGIVKELSK